MSRKEKSRINTSGGNALGNNPFGALAGSPFDALSDQALDALSGEQTGTFSKSAPPPPSSPRGEPPATAATGKRPVQRIDVRREKSGRGGKTVTVVGGEGLAALDAAAREALLRQLKNRFGCGGKCEGALIELQGNLTEQLVPVLSQMGWRVVRTGG